FQSSTDHHGCCLLRFQRTGSQLEGHGIPVMKRYLKLAGMVIAALALLAIGGTYGASYYYTSQYGQGCASCHEMANYVSVVHGSPHRTTNCMDCHEASMGTKLRHIRVHVLGGAPETIRLRDKDVLAMVPNCQSCH